MTTSKQRSTTKRLLPRGVGDEGYRKANRERQAKLRAGRKAEAQAAAALAERNRTIDAIILSAVLSKPDSDLLARFHAAFPDVMRQVGRDLEEAGFDHKAELLAAARRHKRTRHDPSNGNPPLSDTPVTRTTRIACEASGIADWTKEELEFMRTDFDMCMIEDPVSGELTHVDDRDRSDHTDDPDPDDIGTYDADDEGDLPEGHG